MVTDGVGTLYGRFKIPNTETKRFRVGTRTFRLTDSSTNSLVPGVVETSQNVRILHKDLFRLSVKK